MTLTRSAFFYTSAGGGGRGGWICLEGIVYVVSCDTSRAETLQRPLTLDKLVQAGSNNMTSWQKFTYIMNLYWKVILQVTDAKN